MTVNDEQVTAPGWIDWNGTIKKEARGVDNYDLGEVQDVGATYIHTQKGVATKQHFYIPKYLVEGYDGSTLWFKVSENDASSMIRDSPPSDADYRTKYMTPTMRSDIEQRIPRIAQRNSGPSFVRDLLIEEMKDLYSAENQLVSALPKMSDAAHDPQLKQSFQTHLEQTRGHVNRLQQAFQILGESAEAKLCLGMQGLVKEGEQEISEGREMPSVEADLALITAAQKVEHYEISGYGSAKTKAERLGRSDVADLLEQTEREEKQTDELLSRAAMPMLQGTSGTTI